jgi:hypothetical protein
MNAYASENCVFLFCSATDQFEKNGQMLPEKLCGRTIEPIYHPRRLAKPVNGKRAKNL